jgi:poly(hydroxyalkanoate) granule-associated protein
MAEKIQIEEEQVDEGMNTFVGGLRRVLLAGVGAFSLAQGEAEKFVKKLIDRGELAESDGRKLLDELQEKRKDRMDESRKKVSEEMEKRMETLLQRMNVPTKADIDTLSSKVAELTKKIDELKK